MIANRRSSRIHVNSQLKPGELVYTDFIAEARRISAELKADGAEFIIAVTHCREANDLLLTKEVKDIDLLLGTIESMDRYLGRGWRVELRSKVRI